MFLWEVAESLAGVIFLEENHPWAAWEVYNLSPLPACILCFLEWLFLQDSKVKRRSSICEDILGF